jgi:hypothetical protein
MPQDPDLEPRPVRVRTTEGDVDWLLAPSRSDGGEWSIVLTSPDRSWVGTGGNCFGALRNLRAQVDSEGILLGVNGARPDCTVSGMLADMGEGRSAYVLVLGARGRPETVRTLDAAPVEAVASVADQDTFRERWLSRRTE